METCHLRNTESVLSNDKLLESNAAAELSLRAAFNAQTPPPLTGDLNWLSRHSGDNLLTTAH